MSPSLLLLMVVILWVKGRIPSGIWEIWVSIWAISADWDYGKLTFSESCVWMKAIEVDKEVKVETDSESLSFIDWFSI
jgi:hypothetical protein